MDFKKSRQQFRQLAEKYRQGRITGENFADAVDNLAVTDDEGREWKIGLQSGKWYRKDGEEWVEDSPAEEKSAPIPARPKETPAEKRVRRLILAMVMSVVVGAICFGSLYFSNGGALFSMDFFGNESGAGGEIAQDDSLSGGLMGAGDQGQSESDEDLGDSGEVVELATLTAAPQGDSGAGEQPQEAATEAPLQPTTQPTPTFTATPPEPSTPPQVWHPLRDSVLNDIDSFSGEWRQVPERDWEYEVLDYYDREALFLQFDVSEALFYAGEGAVNDVERTLIFALPDEDGQVDILCRWQGGSGYALSLTNQQWRLLKIEQGSETVLENGATPDAFQQGDYAAFRLRCSGQQISAWRGDKLLGMVQDGSYSSGAPGLRFSAPGGVAIAYLASDSLRAHLAGQETAGQSDSVWMGLLEVSAPRDVAAYPAMQEADYSGQPLVGVRLRFSNLASTQVVALAGQNMYLTDGSRRVYALEFVPQTAGDATALELPQTLDAGNVVAGEVFFAGVSAEDLANGWVLVVDLRYQALGEARFEIE